MILQMNAKNVNEFAYELNTIYILFIIHNFNATVYEQYFE